MKILKHTWWIYLALLIVFVLYKQPSDAIYFGVCIPIFLVLYLLHRGLLNMLVISGIFASYFAILEISQAYGYGGYGIFIGLAWIILGVFFLMNALERLLQKSKLLRWADGKFQKIQHWWNRH